MWKRSAEKAGAGDFAEAGAAALTWKVEAEKASQEATRWRELSKKATLVLQDASGSELITKNHLDRQIIDLQLEVEMLRGTSRGGALQAKERELEEARTHRSKLKAKVKEKVSQQLHHLPREMAVREARWRERRKGSSAKYAIKDIDADSP